MNLRVITNGDVVCLLSGGPPMTVVGEGSTGDLVRCRWLDGSGFAQLQDFEADALRPAGPDDMVAQSAKPTEVIVGPPDRDVELRRRCSVLDAEVLLEDGAVRVPAVLRRADEVVEYPLDQVRRSAQLQERAADAPWARREEAQLHTPQSFIEHWQRMSGPNSVIFETADPSFTAVYDYDTRGGPAWRRERATYKPQRTEGWEVWASVRELSLEEFIELLEKWGEDLAPRPAQASDKAGTEASPEELLTSLYNFTIDTSSSYSRRYDPSTGFTVVKRQSGSDSDATRFFTGFYVDVAVFEGTAAATPRVSIAIKIKNQKPVFVVGVKNAGRIEREVLNDLRTAIVTGCTRTLDFDGEVKEAVPPVLLRGAVPPRAEPVSLGL